MHCPFIWSASFWPIATVFCFSQSNRKFVQTELKQSITIKNTSTHLRKWCITQTIVMNVLFTKSLWLKSILWWKSGIESFHRLDPSVVFYWLKLLFPRLLEIGFKIERKKRNKTRSIDEREGNSEEKRSFNGYKLPFKMDNLLPFFAVNQISK